MILTQIKIGTQVRPINTADFQGMTKESVGKIVRIREVDRSGKDFYVTIEWDNNTVSFLNKMFLNKTVAVIEEVFA
jgi:DNA-binding beta-propeller fold protein YncE